MIGRWLVLVGVARAAPPVSPADALPDPVAERCVAPLPAFDDAGDEAPAGEGLRYDEVSAALAAVLPYALGCEQPPGRSQLQLTFELVVGCDGRVASLVPVADDGAPAAYIACVSAVIAKADFPAHDRPDGMPVTYPVDVEW